MTLFGYRTYNRLLSIESNDRICHCIDSRDTLPIMLIILYLGLSTRYFIQFIKTQVSTSSFRTKEEEDNK